MSQNLPVIDCSGSPLERGRAHGEAARASIADFAATVTAVHQINNSHARVDADTLRTYCRRNLGFLQDFAPDLVEEMRGIAQGANLPFDDILYLNSFLELEDLRAPGIGGTALPPKLWSPWGCTTFNVTGAATADGRPYIGQTYDMEKYYEKYLHLLRVKPEEGPEALVLTMAGIVGLVGVNSAGVAGVINKIVANDARPGVIYPLVMRKALAAERIGDALGAAIYTSRASGLNYQFSGEGVAFCAETSATYYELLDIDAEGAIAHTNHYLGSRMRDFETPNWLSHGGTMVRRQVAQRFLNQHRGELTPDLLKELTRDHTNFPRCICAHGFDNEGEDTAFHTIFGIVIDPEAGWMDVCVGNPCENDYVRHCL